MGLADIAHVIPLLFATILSEAVWERQEACKMFKFCHFADVFLALMKNIDKA